MSRSSYWDAWKGISIIAVSAIHAAGWSLTFPAGSGNYNFGIALRQFINFPVAFFFSSPASLLSGCRADPHPPRVRCGASHFPT